MALLSYALSDFDRYSSHAESVRRNIYRELHGCPLLLMSDGSIKYFPSRSQDSIAHMSSALHYLLPRMRKQLLNPILMEKMEIFKDHLFQDTVFVGKITSDFLRVIFYINYFAEVIKYVGKFEFNISKFLATMSIYTSGK